MNGLNAVDFELELKWSLEPCAPLSRSSPRRLFRSGQGFERHPADNQQSGEADRGRTRRLGAARIGHRSDITAAGEIVYCRAVAMLPMRDDLMAELSELRGLKRGVLRLGLPLIASSIFFTRLFAVYRGRYPEIGIRLMEQGSKRLEELLGTGEVELAASLLPVSDELDWPEVRQEPLMALLPGGHPSAGRESINLVSLKPRHLFCSSRVSP
jgi:DNA-binding transcriptional LysR family regulator